MEYSVKLQEETHTLYSILIDSIDEELVEFLDEKLVMICEGNVPSNLNTVKKRLHDFFEGLNERQKRGATAEFFTHLFLSDNEFKQECVFKNLEENSLKKGFDGYYSKNDCEWVMESKSGSCRTVDISHLKKVKQGYKDLSDKISGKSSNNPWQNAFNHADKGSVGTCRDILTNLQTLSDNYTNNDYEQIGNLNIILSATLYKDNTCFDVLCNDILQSVNDYLCDASYSNAIVLCFTKNSYDEFVEYLEDCGDNNG